MNTVSLCDPIEIRRPFNCLETDEMIRIAVKLKFIELGICDSDYKYDRWIYRLGTGTKINKALCQRGERVLYGLVEVDGRKYRFEYGFASDQIVIDLFLVVPELKTEMEEV